MSTPTLFPDSGDAHEPTARPAAGLGPEPPPRLRRPVRDQMVMRPCSIDELIAHDHDARMVWGLVRTWDLSLFLQAVRARGEAPGRASTDPRLLIALWLYAATQGVAGGREPARLCRGSDPYRWLCGPVSVNYHMLNDFRVENAEPLKGLLTQMPAVLIRGEVVAVSRIARDGTRVRASAGAGGFKRRETIESSLQRAEAHLEVIAKQAGKAEGAAGSPRRRRPRGVWAAWNRPSTSWPGSRRPRPGRRPSRPRTSRRRPARPTPRRGP